MWPSVPSMKICGIMPEPQCHLRESDKHRPQRSCGSRWTRQHSAGRSLGFLLDKVRIWFLLTSLLAPDFNYLDLEKTHHTPADSAEHWLWMPTLFPSVHAWNLPVAPASFASIPFPNGKLLTHTQSVSRETCYVKCKDANGLPFSRGFRPPSLPQSATLPFPQTLRTSVCRNA